MLCVVSILLAVFVSCNIWASNETRLQLHLFETLELVYLQGFLHNTHP